MKNRHNKTDCQNFGGKPWVTTGPRAEKGQLTSKTLKAGGAAERSAKKGEEFLGGGWYKCSPGGIGKGKGGGEG